LLRAQVARGHERLARVRLAPALVERRVADASRRFDALSRLFQSLNPDAPLARGFARVMAGDALVRSSADARAAGRVTLKFADGEIGAVTDDNAAPAPAAPRRSRQPDSKPGQSDLFD
jgi:exodeoxyribonuclease VII large subunit